MKVVNLLKGTLLIDDPFLMRFFIDILRAIIQAIAFIFSLNQPVDRQRSPPPLLILIYLLLHHLFV